MGRAGTAYGKRRVSYRALVGKTARKRPLVKPTHIWKIIKIDL